MKTNFTFILLASLTLIACKAEKAMDNTNKMLKTTEAMNSKMEQTNAGIESTNESVRLQKLILSKDDMLKDENTRNLEPVALGMIPGAKKFGEAATTTELVEFTYLLLKEINDQKPDESDRLENGEYKPEVIAAYDHIKMIKFSELITIAGMAPEEKVDQIIQEQIYGGGLYQEEAYAFLMGRVMFLGTYLDSGILSRPLNTVERMNEAITRLGSIDNILKMPFKNEVKMNVTGFLKRDAIAVSAYAEDGTLDALWNMPKLWKKVLKAFDRDLKDGNIVRGSSSSQKEVSAKIASMKRRVEAYIKLWEIK